jgi:hypothetical protein
MSIPAYAVAAPFAAAGASGYAAPFSPAQANLILFAVLSLAVVSAPLGFLLPRLISLEASEAGKADPAAALVRCQARVVLSDTMFEAVAVYGLLGRTLGVHLAWSYGLIALAFLLMGINTARVRGWLADLADASRE